MNDKGFDKVDQSKNLNDVATELLGVEEAEFLFRSLAINSELMTTHAKHPTQHFNQAQIAMLLNVLLFRDLIERVPEAKSYVEEQLQQKHKICFDHGALRTVAIDMKTLPKGKAAFSRILEPLGYVMTGKYPLEKLKMCGYVYTHKDYPEDIPQYFVSELYPNQFSEVFQSSVKDIVYESSDALTEEAQQLLRKLESNDQLSFEETSSLLKILPNCFNRQHDIPSLEHYKILLAESAEMAWIATEGNAFNHATDRVSDLDALEEQERRKGRNVKPKIEEGINANIRQTAYRASAVERHFKDQGKVITMQVPGSFFEFIQRGTVIDPQTKKPMMDLRFDSRNAQGIFKMTENRN